MLGRGNYLEGALNPEAFPVSTDDRCLVNSFRDHEIELPVGFARSVLSFVFRKPRTKSEERSHAEWNRKHRQEVIRHYAT